MFRYILMVFLSLSGGYVVLMLIEKGFKAFCKYMDERNERRERRNEVWRDPADEIQELIEKMKQAQEDKNGDEE